MVTWYVVIGVMAEGGVLTEECRVRRTDGWMDGK